MFVKPQELTTENVFLAALHDEQIDIGSVRKKDREEIISKLIEVGMIEHAGLAFPTSKGMPKGHKPRKIYRVLFPFAYYRLDTKKQYNGVVTTDKRRFQFCKGRYFTDELLVAHDKMIENMF